MDFGSLKILFLLAFFNLVDSTAVREKKSVEDYKESMEEAKKLSDFINNAIKNNDKKTRPNAGGPPVVVEVEFKVVSFGEIKEAEMIYSMDIFFRQWWYDPRFAHNFSTPFTMAADATQLFWTPDTYFWNSKLAKYHRVTRENMRVMINPDGKIYFSTRITLVAQCDMDLRLYPMDTQECPLIIESYAHTRSDVDYVWKGKSGSVEIVSKEMAQFEFMGATTIVNSQTNSKGSFASLHAKFRFKRRVNYFITATYMPAMILVILSWCTFWIHRNAVPARVTLSITTILTTILLYGTVNASMPKVSYSKALDYFLMTSLGIIFMSLLEYVLVLNTHPNLRRRTEEDEIASEPLTSSEKSGNSKDLTPDTIVTMMDKTSNGRQSTMKDKITTCLAPKPKLPNEKNLPYLDVHWIDRTARVIFPLVYFTFVIAYWIYYVSHPETDFSLF